MRGGLLSAKGTTYPDSKTPIIHSKQDKDHVTSNSNLPCEGWWKRKTNYIFHCIKGVTTVCSVVAAGAVVGFVIMGQRFWQDNWQFRLIYFSLNSEIHYQSLSEKFRGGRLFEQWWICTGNTLQQPEEGLGGLREENLERSSLC